MSWSLQNGSLDIATLQKLYYAGTMRPIELVEAVYERIAHCAVPHIQALAALTETLQDLPRVAGSAA
jgi:hypothetical protein